MFGMSRNQAKGMAFEIIYQLSDWQIVALHQMYQTEWWTRGRDLAGVRRMIKNSDVVIAIQESETKQLAGFLRILTDFVYRAYVFDVIVASPYRNQGLGRMLMEALQVHPALQALEGLELYCLPEMVSFYEKWGFREYIGSLKRMQWKTVSH